MSNDTMVFIGPSAVRLQCKHCNREFTRAGALKVHEEKQHADAEASASCESEAFIEIQLLESE